MFAPLRLVVTFACLLIVLSGVAASSLADDASALRLVPFPKRVELKPGRFRLDRPLVLEVPAARAELLGQLVNDELTRAGLPAAKVQGADGTARVARLGPKPAEAAEAFSFRKEHGDEDYHLAIGPELVVCEGAGDAGLLYAVQTLCQLIRANRDASGVPCLAIRDWPSLRWRCLQDDMTRGPSSTLATLKHEVALGASLKMNLFTYYMEYQYAFKKHPLDRAEGRLARAGGPAPRWWTTPSRWTWTSWATSSRSATSSGILAHQKYADLRRRRLDVLSPAMEETYQLLDDLYSEVCPLLPFRMFNVCCDETYGLGTGPSKDLAEKIGVGGVYVRHIRRVHDLLARQVQQAHDDVGRHHPPAPRPARRDPQGHGDAHLGLRSPGEFRGPDRPVRQVGLRVLRLSGHEQLEPDPARLRRRHDEHPELRPRRGEARRPGHAQHRLGGRRRSRCKATNWHGYAWGAECAWNASTTDARGFQPPHRRPCCSARRATISARRSRC